MEEERRRLGEGAAGQEPPGELDSLEVRAADPAATLGRVREVLDVVVAHGEGGWPEVDEGKGRLPAWVVATCVDDRELQECVLDRWSLRAWLYWRQPDQRHWRWWDAEPAGPDGTLRIRLLVLSRPYLRGSLDWLLTVSGGELAA